MKKKSIYLFLICCTTVLLTGCNTHTHTYSPASCDTPATCLECGDTQGEPLGHTTSVGLCKRCGKIQNEKKLELLNKDFADIMAAGDHFIACIMDLSPLSAEDQYAKFQESDNYIETMKNLYDEIIKACEGEDELDRIRFQAKLLKHSAPDQIPGDDATSVANQTVLYQLYLHQISSSFSYLSEDMDYLAGNREQPAPVAFFREAAAIPTPDSTIFGVSYDSELTDSGVKQYMYLLGDSKEDADANYNNYLSAIRMSGNFDVSIDNEYAFATENGNLVSAMIAGSDPAKGYYLIVSFKG